VDSWITYVNVDDEETRVFPQQTRVTITREAKTNAAEIFLTYSDVVINGEVFIQPGEQFKIYAKRNGLITSPLNADLLMVVRVIDYDLMPEDRLVKFVCSDFTYDMLASLYTRSFALSDGLSADEIIENIVQTGAEDGLDASPVTTNIASLDSLGGSFPTVVYSSLWKTNYEAISELSQTNYTDDDKQYLFWFDPDGTFNWLYPPDTNTGTFVFGEGDVLKIPKITKEESEVITMVVYDCGEDLNGNSILNFFLKPDAGSISGTIKYQPYTDISNRLKADTSITDNTVFIEKAIIEGEARARALINKVGKGTWKTTLDVKGDIYEISKLYTVTSIAFPLTSVRADRIIHTIDRNGWKTRIESQEDAE